MQKREELGLPPLPEDSIQVMRSMRAASPPTYSIELMEQQQQKRGHRSRRVRAGASSWHTAQDAFPIGTIICSRSQPVLRSMFPFPPSFIESQTDLGWMGPLKVI